MIAKKVISVRLDKSAVKWLERNKKKRSRSAQLQRDIAAFQVLHRVAAEHGTLTLAQTFDFIESL